MMNMHRKELLAQYLEKVLQMQVAERDRGRAELCLSAMHYLNTADPQQRFSEPIVTIFSTNIGAKTSLDFAAARNVFSIMEKYAINLLDCPWKREFRKITMYSGFYKTRIESSLKDAWKLLLMMGYEKVGLCLELKSLPEASRLEDMAFEFFLASLECSIYKDIFKKVSSLGFTLKDIHKCRSSISGNSDAIIRALPKLCLSRKSEEGEGSDLRASSHTRSDLSKLPNRQQFEHPGFESNIGSEVHVGATLSESSHQHMGSVSEVGPLPDQATKGGSECETRSESIEAMLQQVTPEMIYSDVNIRRQILDKLVRPSSAKSQDEHIHASLPLHQAQHESDRRPYTEPLFIPKQPKPDEASASAMLPYSEPRIILKQPKAGVISASDKNIEPNISKHKTIESKVLPNIHPYTEQLPVPKQKSTVDSGQRPWTENVTSKKNRVSTEPISAKWQCAHCYYSNDAAASVKKCEMCGKPRKEV